MQYTIGETRLAKFIKSIFGRKDVPKSVADTLKEKFINSYLSKLEKGEIERFQGWGKLTYWNYDNELRGITAFLKGREGYLVQIHNTLVETISNMIGVSNDEAYDLIIDWLKPHLDKRYKIMDEKRTFKYDF